MKRNNLSLCVLLCAVVLVLLGPVRAAEHDARPLMRLSAMLSVGDTACYRHQYHAYDICHGDTFCTTALVYDFRLVVKDSSARGWTMECTLTDVLANEKDNKSVTGLLSGHILSHLKNTPLTVRTDSVGRIVHIDCWKNLSERIGGTCRLLLDEVYRNPQPTTDSFPPRDSLERRMAHFYDSEDHLLSNLFRALPLLFGLNGTDLPLGWTRDTYSTATEGRPESRLTLFADTVPAHKSEDDPYGGILANMRNIEVVPILAIAEQRRDSRIRRRFLTDPLVMPLVRQAIEEGDAGQVKMAHNRMMSYFFNGWPKEMLVTRTAEYVSTRKLHTATARIEQDYLVWTRLKTAAADHRE